MLERARETGFFGPGPIDAHLRHSEGFATAAEDALGRGPRSFADLGTGGGIPGLVLACRWVECPALLIEVGQRRAGFLRDAVAELGLGEQVEVLEERAEAAGRGPLYREQFDLVTARSFAIPAVTAEIAAGMVRVGGFLVVSEPPETDDERWPRERLGVLGFGPADVVEVELAHFAVIAKVRPVSSRYPRPVGRPAKRPLW